MRRSSSRPSRCSQCWRCSAFPLAPLLASAGVGGVALGFGAQALVRDYLSGIFMILEDQYGVGDFIDTGEAVGTVEEVTLRVTRLRDLDGVVWHVRNGEIIRIGNRSQGWSTVMVDLPFSYGEDVDRVIGIITDAVSRMKDDGHWSEVLRETPSVLGVETITAGTVTVRVFATCTPNENWGIQREIRRRVKEAFDREGIAGPPVSPGGTGQHRV
uniref:Mechanosensitive ion channel family protein n=1 Tax=Janibacter limosus TaxID=53458 RepID=A0AC61U1H6_9MICO|nr:mechanosensitive ion channel family protein [Janibacter limosus]